MCLAPHSLATLFSAQGLPMSPDVAAGRAPFTAEHVSWLYDANARQLVTAFSGTYAGMCRTERSHQALPNAALLLQTREPAES